MQTGRDAGMHGCWDAGMQARGYDMSWHKPPLTCLTPIRDADAWLERPDGAGNCNSRGWAQVLDSVGSSRRGMTMVRVEVRVAIFLV